jgi:leucine dehydrogenase
MNVFDHSDFDNHEAVHFIRDEATGLRAIIAIHSTALGPAAGGCRMWPYSSEEEALKDALRLSKGMSYKNAIAGLAYGGGKAVIIGDPQKDKTPELFRAFGRAVENLGGQYITAEDVGVRVEDMQTVASQTRFVSGLPKAENKDLAGGDPSPKTARGVYHGICAAIKHRLKRTDLNGLRVAVQGLGGVGYYLCKELNQAGADLIVADIHHDRLDRARAEFDATVVDPQDILETEADVLAPCALGGVINDLTIEKLAVPIIAGGANNQLAAESHGQRLLDKGILYAPDYVINGGGIINVIAEYDNSATEAEVFGKIAGIEATLLEIFERSDAEHRPTNEIANELARELIAAGSRKRCAA